jgi:hypothetical protein
MQTAYMPRLQKTGRGNVRIKRKTEMAKGIANPLAERIDITNSSGESIRPAGIIAVSHATNATSKMQQHIKPPRIWSVTVRIEDQVSDRATTLTVRAVKVSDSVFDCLHARGSGLRQS